MSLVNQEVELFNLKLIKEVQKRPVLYDRSVFDSSFRETQKAWGEVARVMGLTKTSCKWRWRNLRTVFSRHIKSNKKHSYYLTEALEFLRPHFRAPIKLEHVNLEEQSEIGEYHEEIAINTKTLIDDDRDQPEMSDHKEEQHSEAEEAEEELEERQEKKRESKKRRRFKMAAATDDIFVSNETEGSYRKMFLLSMLPELEEMSNVQFKVFKRKVFTLMDDITDEFD